MEELKMHGFHTTFSAKSSSQELEIPEWYINCIKMKTPCKAYLKGPSGGTWPVELIRREGRLYFQQGWLEFQLCHSLQDKDLLVFRYDGKASFKMNMYQEKFGEDIKEESLQVIAHNPSLSDSEDTQISAQPQPQYAVTHKIKEIRATDSLDRDRLCFVKTMKHYNVRRSLILALPSWFVSEHFSGYGMKIEVLLENTRRQQWPVTLDFKFKTMFGGWSQFVRDNEIKEGDICKFVLVRRLTMLVHIFPKKASSQVKQWKRQANPQLCFAGDKKRRVLKYADDNEIKETRATDSLDQDSPSFVKTMKHYNISGSLVNISAKFVSTHCCSYGQVEIITLENEQGKQWSCNILRKGRGACLAGGWLLFVRDNQIKAKDTCTFKLVGERKMLVQISRHCDTSQVEEDPRVKLEHPTCNTDRKSRSDGLNKRKRGSEKADIAMQVAAATGGIAELREENRRILQMLQEMKNSGAK